MLIDLRQHSSLLPEPQMRLVASAVHPAQWRMEKPETDDAMEELFVTNFAEINYTCHVTDVCYIKSSAHSPKFVATAWRTALHDLNRCGGRQKSPGQNSGFMIIKN